MAVPEALIDLVRTEFVLRLDGIHGEAHWARVCANGLRLAEQTGADAELVALFAYLHDVKRQGDGWDRDHGRRAAEFIRGLPGPVLTLPVASLDLLAYACAAHGDGLTEAEVTVQTCWDADRLDLGRIGIQPNPRRLCTAAARDPATIEWAFLRSQQFRVVTAQPGNAA